MNNPLVERAPDTGGMHACNTYMLLVRENTSEKWRDIPDANAAQQVTLWPGNSTSAQREPLRSNSHTIVSDPG